MSSDPDSVRVGIPSNYCFIYKVVSHAGMFGNKPRDDSECVVGISNVSVDGQVVDLNSVPKSFSEILRTKCSGTIHIGWGDTFVDKGLESCIRTMFPQEKSEFTLLFPKEISWDLIKHPPKDPMVINCTIYLEKFSHPCNIYEMTDSQLYGAALKHKNRGVDLFQEGRTVDAFLRFSKAFKMFHFVNKAGENVNAGSVKQLGMSILNDMALCQFKFGNFNYTVELCGKAVALDTNNEKALYRRALAHIELKNYEEAENDLSKLLRVKPGSRYVVEKYRELKTLTKETDKEYTAVVKKMFS